MTGLIASEIRKNYGDLRANDGICLEVRPGQIHALLGENGAGKSTFIGVLTGRVTPDSGTVTVDGVVVRPGRPEEAASAGIGAVFQDLLLIPSMTGFENLSLAMGEPPNRFTRDHIVETQRRYKLHAPLDVPARELELPVQQRLELVRALATNPRVLLLDEPTTYLPPTLVDGFLQQVRRIADEGIAVVLITHRLPEARAIADQVTILRRGQVVAQFPRGKDLPDAVMASEMLGESLVELSPGTAAPGDTVISCEHVSVTDGRGARLLDDVSLAVRQGEIVGLAGVDGNGQQPLLEVLAGLRPVSSGTVRLGAVNVSSEDYFRRYLRGVRFVSADRRRHGIVPTYTVGEHFEFVHGSAIRARLHDIFARVHLTPNNPAHTADKLSGGNQQKFILARALEGPIQLLLAAYPTQGLDVRARVMVHQLLLDARDAGRAVVFSSTDLDELLTVADRVVVLNRGRIVGAQHRGAYDRQLLAEWYVNDAA